MTAPNETPVSSRCAHVESASIRAGERPWSPALRIRIQSIFPALRGVPAPLAAELEALHGNSCLRCSASAWSN